MASPYEQTFLSSLTERKRKPSDISEGLKRLKNVSLSELSDLCSVLSKDDILLLLQAKVPNARRLAEIVRALPSAMPRAAENTLSAYYFKTFAAVGEIDQEKFANALLLCSADQQKSGNEGLIRRNLLKDFNLFARRMRLQYVFNGKENKQHPFYVKSTWQTTGSTIRGLGNFPRGGEI